MSENAVDKIEVGDSEEYDGDEYWVERLSLRTMERYISAIISGEQQLEQRRASPFYDVRLLRYIDKRKVKWDAVRQVKVLHLYAGNQPNSKFVDVRVLKNRLVEYLRDVPEGWKKGDQVYEFELGDVVAHG
ncbi:MAG: hypothetical protein LBJ57_06380 [Prevotellaceae bacterium]|jgi:hypothetical protein|nr:hypothetical protein [Prevotellaceae bacterium]